MMKRLMKNNINKNVVEIFCLLLFFSLIGCIIEKETITNKGETMRITSKSFEHGKSIPSEFTCDGNNTNPALEFKDVPENAKSLVLIMDDPDIPAFVKEKYSIQVWDHWIVFNIPPETREVTEGNNPKGLLGVNTAGKKAYGSPCPPDREHHYFFKLYALDTMLSLKEGSTKKEVETAMEEHILAKAELIGLYERKK